MFLFVVLGLLVYADETQEQQVERLIKLLQGQNGGVRKNAASTLGSIGEGAIHDNSVKKPELHKRIVTAGQDKIAKSQNPQKGREVIIKKSKKKLDTAAQRRTLLRAWGWRPDSAAVSGDQWWQFDPYLENRTKNQRTHG